MIRRIALVLVFLLAFGLARLSLERRIGQELQAHHFREGPVLEESMRDKLGQLGFAASLGGFRSFLAMILSIKATNAWSKVDWPQVELDYNLLTQLQPRVADNWDMAAWHMSGNARSHFLNWDTQRGPLERHRLAQYYGKRGLQFLEDGLRYNPQSLPLRKKKGDFYLRVEPDPCRAAEAFREAVEVDGTGTQMLRFSAYQLAECPGRERDAYDLLMALYQAGERYSTLIEKIKLLEEKFSISREQRIPEVPLLRRKAASAR